MQLLSAPIHKDNPDIVNHTNVFLMDGLLSFVNIIKESIVESTDVAFREMLVVKIALLTFCPCLHNRNNADYTSAVVSLIMLVRLMALETWMIWQRRYPVLLLFVISDCPLHSFLAKRMSMLTFLSKCSTCNSMVITCRRYRMFVSKIWLSSHWSICFLT